MLYIGGITRSFYPRPVAGRGFFNVWKHIELGRIRERKKNMYEKVSTNLNFVEREKETEKFWKDELNKALKAVK